VNGFDMNQDVLALVCPDWRSAALVLDIATRQISYANWRCLDLLNKSNLVRIASGTLDFCSEEMTHRFQAALDRSVIGGMETVTLIEAGGGDAPAYSVTIRNPHGFFREALVHHVGSAGQLVIVEFATSWTMPEPLAFSAFGRAFVLNQSELSVVLCMVLGSSTEEMSRRLGATEEAVQQHIQSVHAKTGCRQPSQIVRLVMSLCPLEAISHGINPSKSEATTS
jgi:DNA-binding CsgD family transcriptional regulator